MEKSVPVTITQRMKAAAIVKKFRDNNNLAPAADHFGICACYVICIEKMTKKKNSVSELTYYAPGWAVLKVLEKAA